MSEIFKLWDSEKNKVIEVEANKVGREWKARCPNHHDEKASLSINTEKEVYHCFGCGFDGHLYNATTSPVLKLKQNVEKKDPPIATYNYTDEKGKLLYQVLKYRDKTFPQRQPNGSGGWINNIEGVRRVLYRLPELLKAGNTVYLVEGEKDADNLLALGLTATTNPMGAGKWQADNNRYLKHFKTVILLPDNDLQGRLHVRRIGNSLLEDDFKDVRLLDLPGLAEGEDISDWLEKDGNDKDLLLSYTEKAPSFTPFDITLEQVLSIFRKWLVLKETDYIEAVLATVVSNLIPGDPVWVFLTGQSGGSKTEVLRTLSECRLIYPVSKFTAHTMISGKRMRGQPDPSLLPLLNNKVMVIKDFSCILEMPRDDRAQIFADMRDSYDGEASKKLGIEQKQYKYKSHYSVIAGVTGAIDDFTSVQHSLGERFIKVRLSKSSINDEQKRTLRALDNVGEQQQMRKELSKIVSNFLSQPFKPSRVTIPSELKMKLTLLAVFVGKCRTSVSRDPWNKGVIKYPPDPESGTRLVIQFAKLIKSLATIRGKTVAGEEEFSIIQRIGLDSLPRKRLLMMEILYTNTNGLTTSDIGKLAKLGGNTALLAMHDLEALDLVEGKKAENERGSPWYWSLTDDFTDTFDRLEIWPVLKAISNRK